MIPPRFSIVALALCLATTGCSSVLTAARDEPINDNRGTRTSHSARARDSSGSRTSQSSSGRQARSCAEGQEGRQVSRFTGGTLRSTPALLRRQSRR